jgi:hypothetical protein
MGIFSRLVKQSNKPIEKRSIVELIETVPHVNPMNQSTIRESVKEGNDKHWLNPNNQTCFNSGWFTHQDFIDWANGTGPIVKGNTQDEKDKFMKYAKAYTELDLSIFIYEEYLDLLDTNVILHGKSNHGDSKYFQDLSKKPAEETIRLFLSNMAREIKDELITKIGYERYCNPTVDIKSIIEEKRRKYNDISFNTCWTLSILGKGYFAACNAPSKIENLAWSHDLPFAVAYKEFLEEDGYELPDFKWVKDNRYNR